MIKAMKINMIKKILYSYFSFCIIQIACFVATSILLLITDNEKFTSNGIAGLFSFSVYSFFVGWVNTLFLILLYFVGINKVILINKKACIVENVIYYVLSVGIRFIISLIPTDMKFYYHDIIANGNIISSNAYTLRFCYTDEAQIIYVYTILLLFYIVKRAVSCHN